MSVDKNIAPELHKNVILIISKQKQDHFQYTTQPFYAIWNIVLSYLMITLNINKCCQISEKKSSTYIFYPHFILYTHAKVLYKPANSSA